MTGLRAYDGEKKAGRVCDHKHILNTISMKIRLFYIYFFLIFIDSQCICTMLVIYYRCFKFVYFLNQIFCK